MQPFLLPIHQMEELHIFQPVTHFFQTAGKIVKKLLPLLLHHIHTRIHPSHQNIARTAALINTKVHFQPLPVYPVPLYMKKSRLGQRGHGFM